MVSRRCNVLHQTSLARPLNVAAQVLCAVLSLPCEGIVARWRNRARAISPVLVHPFMTERAKDDAVVNRPEPLA